MVFATTAIVTFNAGGFMDVWGVDHIANCFQISAFVLCIFEHILTLDREITRVWRRRISPVMLLFIINRYACLCYAASGLVQLAAWGDVDSHTANNICNITSRIGDISEDIMYLMFAFFAALRTCAIWDKNRAVFACVLLPGLIFPIGAIYSDVVSTYTSHVGSGATGCYKENYFPADGSHSAIESYNNFYTVGRCSIILFECITLSLTWAKTIPVVRRLRHHSLSTGSLISHCILYNGTLQFTVVLITTVLNLLGSLSPTAGDTEVFVIILASILLSRFILDLREDPNVAQKVDDDGLLRHVSGVSNIRFAEAQRSEDSGGSIVVGA